MNNKKKPARKILRQQVDFLAPGMELAQDVLSAERMILAGKGSIISIHTIDKLRKWQISSVSTYAEVPVNLVESPLAKQFIAQYLDSVNVVRSAFDVIANDAQLANDIFNETTEKLTDKLSLAGNVVDLLYSFPEAHTDFYHHSVNVSVIASLLASWLGFPPEAVSAVSLAGLLHDLGKTRLDSAAQQEDESAPAEIKSLYQSHCRIGFELVRALPDVGESIARAVLEHHERTDGSGFPLHIEGKKIHPYAQIIALADLYDKTVSVKKGKDVFFSPYAGLEQIWQEISRLSPQHCFVFRENMNNFLSGHQVMLTDSRKARVVHLSPEQPSRSIVQLEDGMVVDLSGAGDLSIHHVLR